MTKISGDVRNALRCSEAGCETLDTRPCRMPMAWDKICGRFVCDAHAMVRGGLVFCRIHQETREGQA